ncbi:MAG: hypothetical protein M0R30_06070 [Methanoregula sp.]|jgi:hypothetical protein|uniref:hypothetical protein n=1 Tax=Methanoregula sp. TaxID=2052170 RepID=UPI0025F6E3C5|nr:hypothetical protein [Methanoregula sp.]MCK9631192.1 hypothetical protein [Methanoregula sp.]
MNIIVESTTNIQAWIPTLTEMIKKNWGSIEVYSPLKFNDDYTDLLIGAIDQSYYSIQIITLEEFNDYLDFFRARTKDGDTISVWESVGVLEDLIDNEADTNAELKCIPMQSEKEIERLTIDKKIPDEIKSSSAEELAGQIIAFAKKESADQLSDIRMIISMFWENKNVNKWDLPWDLQLKVRKADRLAQKQLDDERERKENDEILSLVDPCVEWAKKYGLKKITEADIDGFILERDTHGFSRTKKRSLQSLVKIKLKKENPEVSTLINPCVSWAKELGLKMVTETNIDDFLSKNNIDVSPRTKKRELYTKVNSILKSN